MTSAVYYRSPRGLLHIRRHLRVLVCGRVADQRTWVGPLAPEALWQGGTICGHCADWAPKEPRP